MRITFRLVAVALTAAALALPAHAADQYMRLSDTAVVNLARVDVVEFHRVATQEVNRVYFRIVIHFSGTKDPYFVDYTDETKAQDAWKRLTDGAMNAK
jgi:hypothetical protein